MKFGAVSWKNSLLRLKIETKQFKYYWSERSPIPNRKRRQFFFIQIEWNFDPCRIERGKLNRSSSISIAGASTQDSFLYKWQVLTNRKIKYLPPTKVNFYDCVIVFICYSFFSINHYKVHLHSELCRYITVVRYCWLLSNKYLTNISLFLFSPFLRQHFCSSSAL